MPRTCTICDHPKRFEIDVALATKSAGFRKLATAYKVHESALYRHARNCSMTLHKAMKEIMADALGRAESRTILQQMAALHQRALAILARAEAADELDTALRAVRECRGNLELLARLDGTLTPASAPATGPITIQVQYVDRPTVVQPGSTPAQLEEGE